MMNPLGCVLLRVRDDPAASSPTTRITYGTERRKPEIAHGPREKNCEKPFSDNSGYHFAGNKLGSMHASSQGHARNVCVCARARLPGARGAVEITRSLATTDHLFPAGSLCPVQIANISRTAPARGWLGICRIDRDGREKQRRTLPRGRPTSGGHGETEADPSVSRLGVAWLA